jgi:CheY-like chemotaxis protein
VAQAQTQQEAVQRNVPAQRVLVAEDNIVTKDLLEMLLTQRGHQVDIVTDGKSALEALQNNSYDVVLMDFHLPELDGLEVAASFRDSNGAKEAPRFVAMTSDMKGLLEHAADCENFDGIMPKPFDLEDVCRVIEGQEMPARAEPAEPVSPLGTDDARPIAAKSSAAIPSHIQKLGYNFLRWPDDFDGERLSARGLQASLDNRKFDAILVRERASTDDLAQIWTTKSLFSLPVIDLTGALGARADLDGSKLSTAESDQVTRLVEGFHNRLAKLHDDVLLSDDIGDKLLGHIYLTGRGLKPVYDAQEKGFVCYNAVLPSDVIEQEAKKLVQSEFLSQSFFDRFPNCDRCQSSRFNVREECPDCHSPNIVEQAYLHHFVCAYQGPESDFRQGDDLVCPKCRQELSHFSIDYDKPGSVMVCSTCSHATSEPDVGLLCMDCEAHFDGDTVGAADVFSYALTDRAYAYLETGRALLGRKREAMRFAELPVELIVALNAELKRFSDNNTPFALVDISYRNKSEIDHEHGPRQFDQARDLFLENLDNVLRKEDTIVKGQAYDFALLRDTDPQEVRDGLEDIRANASEVLRLDLGVVMHVYGPEEFA